jgi:hypothetical protein
MEIGHSNFTGTPEEWNQLNHSIKVQQIAKICHQANKSWCINFLPPIKVDGIQTFTLGDYGDEVAKNDGLSVQDFNDWFPSEFSGQIIHWTGVKY